MRATSQSIKTQKIKQKPETFFVTTFMYVLLPSNE